MYNSSDSNLSAHAQPDSDDITFVLYSDNSTQLNHEIENYTTGGQLIAWVNVISISSSSDTKIWMYYGNETCSSQENPTGTWNSDYLMVHHMDDNTTSSIADSTSNNKDGTKDEANDPEEVSGKIGNCQDFTSSSGDNIDVSDTLGVTLTDWTIEIWTTTESVSGAQAWVQKDDGGGTDRTMIGLSGANLHTSYGGSHDWYTGISTNVWYHQTMAYDHNGDDTYWYLNGTFDEMQSNTGAEAANRDWLLGRWKAGASCIDGKMDEFRISTVLRNANWITTSYNTMTNTTTFVTYSSEASQ